MGRLHSGAYIKLNWWSPGFYVTSPYTRHGDVHQGAVLFCQYKVELFWWQESLLCHTLFFLLDPSQWSIPLVSQVHSPFTSLLPPSLKLSSTAASSVWLHIQMILINLSGPQSRFFGKPSHLKWRFVGKVVTKSRSPYDMNTFSRCEYQCPSTTKSAQI
jgi:hypothetical protein